MGNGESFPIRLPNRVSIQGTSALNTVFEPLRGVGPVFEFGSASWNLGKATNDNDTAWSYIDSVSISGTIWLNQPGEPAPSPESQSAIVVRGGTGQRVFLNVSNCFLYCNGIGVLVDAPLASAGLGIPPPESELHRVHLINNTFAWNMIGVWNGQRDPMVPIGSVRIPLVGTTGPVSRGFAHVSCINNIFDSTPPISGNPDIGPVQLEVPMLNQSPSCGRKSLPRGMDRWSGLVGAPTTMTVGAFTLRLPRVHGMSNFEGLDESDLLVQHPTSASLDTNAYEQTRFNRAIASAVADPGFEGNRATFFPTLQFTGPDVVSTTMVTNPANDLTLYTGGFAFTSPGSTLLQNLRVRGAVYVRDLLHLGGWAAGGPFFQTCDFDQSPADFRLAPNPMSWFGSLDPVNRTVPAATVAGWILVDRGFPDVAASQAWPATMDPTGLSTPISVPSHPVPVVAGYPVSNGPWEFDCEGFGNPRVVRGPTANAQDRVDIGADEFDLNAVAGYRAGTTAFLTAGLAGSLPAMDNTFLWFLGVQVPGAGAPVVEVVKPVHALWPAVQNYQMSLPPGIALYLPSYVDTVPHLLPDEHPYHFYTFLPIPNLFPTNWVWETCSPPISGFDIVNRRLFVDPSAGIPNPTGSTRMLGNPELNWLDDPASHALPSGTPLVMTIWPQLPPTPPSQYVLDPLRGFGPFCEHLGPPERPFQHAGISSAPANSAMRFSLEFSRLNAPLIVPQVGGFTKIDRKSNLQSFQVIKL